MVLQKRLDYGFNGYQVPSMPRASRSARRRNSLKKKFENNQMCAFELLATVAGKLLQERESSSASSNVSRRTQPAVARDVSKRETKVGEKQLKVEHCDQENCDDSAFVCNLGLQVHNRNIPSDAPHISDDSIITNPDCSDKFDCVEGSVIARSRNENGKLATEIVGGYPGLYKSYKKKIGGVDGQMGPEPQDISIAPNRTVSDPFTLGNPMNLDIKPPAKLHSDSSLKLLLRRDTFSCGSFSKGRDNVKVMSRNNDDNSSGYNEPSTPTLKTLRAPPRIGDRRIRKLLASRYWKVAPNLKDGELSNSNGDVKPIFRYKKSCYTRQRSHWNPTLKRKKHFEHTFVSTSNQGVESEVISGSSRERFKRNTFQTGVRTHGASGASSSVSGSEPSFQSKDSHVKLSVKSFSIPELFIEIPETATVGSLKRTVKEAVTAILGGGLCVGVLIQGKKVSDDNKTLLQTGMCEDNKLDSLGFELEPNPANVPPLCSEDPPFLLPCDSFLPQTSCPAVSAFNPGTFESSSNPPVTNTDLGNSSESNLDLVPTPSGVPVNKLAPDSRTLVAVPSTSAKALAVVPLHRKSGRPELVQRRIRRPFSVSEVEALVHAVEKLGTGRWRDVKLRAFDNAKHRTYVDLKDKWKTLVHTARISPQQRRGEPVPQELLDRVLSAHAYWSQEQSKPTD